jgi:hypothetical protein
MENLAAAKIGQSATQTIPDRPKSQALDISRFDDGTGETRYRVKGSGGKQYLLPEAMAELLQALNGRRTLTEVGNRLRTSIGLNLTTDQIESVISRDLMPRGLVEPVGDSETLGVRPATPKRSWMHFDFVFRIPLVSAERISPFVQPLTALFRLPMVIGSLLLVFLVHLGIYGNTFEPPSFVLSSGQLELAYILAFLTVCIHELGHATACRYFDCEHGEIGFCLYLTIPALYVDLTDCWRLKRRQRAIIDIGGIYFQLLSAIPLFLMFRLTKEPCYLAALLAVDAMVLFALNPLLKFDGYWLLVDASGIANLQTRALAFLKECVFYLTRHQVPTMLKSPCGRVRQGVLIVYASFIGVGIVGSIPYLALSIPRQVQQLVTTIVRLPAVIVHDPKLMIMECAKLIGSVLFFTFLLRFIRMLLSGALKRVSPLLSKITMVPAASADTSVGGEQRLGL